MHSGCYLMYVGFTFFVPVSFDVGLSSFCKKNPNRIWILYYRASPVFKFLKEAKLRLISALNFNLGGSQLWTEFQTQYFYCIIRGFCPDFFLIFISKVHEILFFRFVVRNHLTAPQVKIFVTIINSKLVCFKDNDFIPSHWKTLA